MNYSETLDYLYTRLPMFSRTGAAALKPGLGNTLRLCAAVGNPQSAFRSIHIAGTNGKGSTSHMLAAILQQAEYKTGLYTSPHLIDFRERIRIDGNMISEAFVVDFVSKCESVIEEISPSFFEITVAMAFAVFAIEQVDIAIIETGLGGRLDSTNVINPELSIITNISLDHTDLLGDTRGKIAVEKAGIIKKRIPVVIGEKDTETIGVFQEAAVRHSSQIFFAEDHYIASWAGFSAGLQQFELINNITNSRRKYAVDLLGKYQSQNLQTVLTACDILKSKGWKIEEKIIEKALQNVTLATGLMGRYQRLAECPLIVADVAHNPAGLQLVLAQWAEEFASTRHIILGFVRDKDVASALKLFPKDARYYFTNAAIPRALPAADLQAIATEAGLAGACFENVSMAIDAALKSASENDGILITGSFFIVGEAMSALTVGADK